MDHDSASSEEANVANTRLAMRRTREILRLKLHKGLSNRDTARAVGASASVVSTMMKRARPAGLKSWAEVEPLTVEELDALLYNERPRPTDDRPRPDPVWIHTERQKCKGVTLELLHAEYLAAHPGGCRQNVTPARRRFAPNGFTIEVSRWPIRVIWLGGMRT